jgi:hypothetical protein
MFDTCFHLIIFTVAGWLRDGCHRDHHQSPYALAQEFIERALHFDDTRIVAMPLRTDFDHAASRAHLFADCAMFAKKVVLTKRIRCFEDSNGSPSFITAG